VPYPRSQTMSTSKKSWTPSIAYELLNEIIEELIP
jgi:hypothetical protein